MAFYVPPTLLAPLPAVTPDPLVGGLVSGVGGLLSGGSSLLGQAVGVYGALEAKKASEKAAKRQYQIDLAAAQAQGAQGSAWLSPPVLIGGVAVLAVAVLLLKRR